ncbi:MAG: methionine synthase, partial [Candidatus Omnitrophota bacterium]
MNLRGLATGIGSLPYEDPAKAVDLVLKYLPQIPFWPQLPKLGGCEGMVAQFAQNLPCLKIS